MNKTTNERSFSTLHHIKTYNIQSIMGKDRLNKQASLNMHDDISSHINKALNELFLTFRRVNLSQQRFVFYNID